jgi:serine protease Do
LRVGSAQGSGVIIRKEGYILTAGHVSKEADKDVVITLYNGKEVKGKTLGANHNLDSGLVKIVDKGDWPFTEMAKSADIKDGAWCLAVGHPGGLKPGRPPVVRLGRILEHRKEYLRSDCTLVGGDSGGPLFDMDGKVIGIHSRIGLGISTNLHVPVDTYRDTWDQLARGEVWGGIAWLKPPNAYMGVNVHPEAKNCLIQEVFPDSPAAKAGLKAKDVIVAIDGKKVKNYMELARFLANKQPGTTITVQARRGNEDVTIRLVLGKRNA